MYSIYSFGIVLIYLLLQYSVLGQRFDGKFEPGVYCKAKTLKFRSCSRAALNVLIIPQNIPIPTLHGSDKRVYNIIESLIGLGHSVNILPFSTISAKSSEYDKQLLDVLQTVRFPSNRKPIVTFDNPMEKYKYV